MSILERIISLSKERKFVEDENQVNSKFIEEKLNDKGTEWEASVSEEDLEAFTDELFQKPEAYKLYKLGAERQMELRKKYIKKRPL